MQRSAASPSSSPDTLPEPPSKRQRLSNGSFNSSPASTPRSDAQAVEEALAAEDQKRADALERESAARGESKWYLSFKEPPTTVVQSPLRIVSAGFSTLDAGDARKDILSEEDEEVTTVPQMKGRRSFGKFNRKIEVRKLPVWIDHAYWVHTETT